MLSFLVELTSQWLYSGSKYISYFKLNVPVNYISENRPDIQSPHGAQSPIIGCIQEVNTFQANRNCKPFNRKSARHTVSSWSSIIFHRFYPGDQEVNTFLADRICKPLIWLDASFLVELNPLSSLVIK